MMMLRVELERLGDLDQLPLARRQALDRRLGREVEVDLREAARACAHASARAVDQRERPDAPPREIGRGRCSRRSSGW